MKYRSEIDGLRAVAVVPVVLFHAGFEAFSGGFVGVDVFFVLSGYLITSIILGDLNDGTFSIVSFYERRARRILPALVFIVGCCLPFAWLWMFPEELKNFGASLIATAIFASNIFFWRNSNYFSPDAELMPLLHTWSLAVEEQYYLIFPLFVAAIWKFKPNKIPHFLVLAAMASLLLSEWGWRNEPRANFYLAPTRGWELLLGSICAYISYGGPVKSNTLMATLGLFCILASIYLFDSSTPFPSLFALMPVGGTALVILYGAPGTWVGRLLSTPALVGLGLISYSTYLWHQPLFAFARLRSIYDLTTASYLLLSVLSVVLAYFTWRFVERPFRKRDGIILRSPQRVFAASAVSGVAMCATGMVFYANHGFDRRFDSDVNRYLSAAQDINPAQSSCLVTPRRGLQAHPIEGCTVIADASRAVDVAILGDSHADALQSVLQEELRQVGISSYAVSYAGCPALPGLVRLNRGTSHKCNEFTDQALLFYEKEGIEAIILAARWTLYYEGRSFDNQEGGHEKKDNPMADGLGAEDRPKSADDLARKKRVLRAYGDGVLGLLNRGFKVVLINPIPEAGWHVPKTLAKKALYGSDQGGELTTNYAVFARRNSDIHNLFDTLKHPNLFQVHPEKILCNTFVEGRCLNGSSEAILYYDDNHLSSAGASLVVQEIIPHVLENSAGASLGESR